MREVCRANWIEWNEWILQMNASKQIHNQKVRKKNIGTENDICAHSLVCSFISKMSFPLFISFYTFFYQQYCNTYHYIHSQAKVHSWKMKCYVCVLCIHACAKVKIVFSCSIDNDVEMGLNVIALHLTENRVNVIHHKWINVDNHTILLVSK